MLNKINLAIFFNNFRGVETLEYLRKKKDIKIKKVFIAKKNLNNKIIGILKKKKINFKIIKDVNKKKISLEIKRLQVDFNILAGFPYILKKFMISSSKFGTLNLHAGKLPKYRGGSPINWQIINGERKIGISIIKINEKIDSGYLINESEFSIGKKDHVKSVHEKVNNIFPILTYRSIHIIKSKKLNFCKKIRLSKSNYFKQRKPEDGRISWKKMGQLQIYNFVRALSYPYPGAFTFNENKKKIIINNCEISKLVIPGIKIGEVRKIRNYYFVKTKRGVIKIISFKGDLKSGQKLQ